MKGFGRGVANLIAVGSLLLSLAVTGVRIRSSSVHDIWAVEAGKSQRVSVNNGGRPMVIVFAIEWQCGRLILSRELTDYGLPLDKPWHGEFPATQPATGIGIDATIGDLSHSVEIPFWFLLGMTTIIPAVWVFRNRGRPQTGFCNRCGYNLRATPERCPECGEITKIDSEF